MDAITNASSDLLGNSALAGVTTENNSEEKEKSASGTEGTAANDFMAFMSRALGKSTSDVVNEEELFAAIIEKRLSEENEEAAEFYKSEKAKFMSSMARPDGYVSVENVALAALKATVEAGKIDEETAATINAESFSAAQLDDNLDALYDSRGSEGDPTIATASMDEAMRKIEEALAKIESGELSVAARALSAGETGASNTSAATGLTGAQQLDGEGGFLWKPASEKDGKLVVLLPTELRDLLDKVEIHSSLPPEGSSLLATGIFSGDEHNGERPHYRFDEPGEAYGSDVYVVAYKTDGEMLSWQIGNGSERND